MFGHSSTLAVLVFMYVIQAMLNSIHSITMINGCDLMMFIQKFFEIQVLFFYQLLSQNNCSGWHDNNDLVVHVFICDAYHHMTWRGQAGS